MLSPFGGLKKVFGSVNKAAGKIGGGAIGTMKRVAGVAEKKKKTAIGPPTTGGTAIDRMSAKRSFNRSSSKEA